MQVWNVAENTLASKQTDTARSSHRRCSKRKGLWPVTFLKKRLWHRCFPVNYAKFIKRVFYRTRLGTASVQLNFLSNIFQSLRNLSSCFQTCLFISKSKVALVCSRREIVTGEHNCCCHSSTIHSWNNYFSTMHWWSWDYFSLLSGCETGSIIILINLLSDFAYMGQYT